VRLSFPEGKESAWGADCLETFTLQSSKRCAWRLRLRYPTRTHILRLAPSNVFLRPYTTHATRPHTIWVTCSWSDKSSLQNVSSSRLLFLHALTYRASPSGTPPTPRTSVPDTTALNSHATPGQPLPPDTSPHSILGSLPHADMSLQSVADVPLIISSPNSSSERRINPSWTIAHLKSRLEPITGVPAGSQQLALRVASQDAVPITAIDEEQTQLSAFSLQPYAEITVSVSLPSHCSVLRALSWNRSFQPLTSCHILLLQSSSAHPSTKHTCVSGPLVYGLLLVLIRHVDRILRLSA
jgi:hypothetical protein